MKKSKNSPKIQEMPSTIAASPESSNSSVNALANPAVPSGVALIKKYKSEGMNVKDAFAAAAKLNSAIKESSFKAGWYKKDVPSSTEKALRGRKPGSKNKTKAATPTKKEAGLSANTSKPVKVSAGNNVNHSSTSSLSAGTKKLVVDALRAQINELETAIKELGN